MNFKKFSVLSLVFVLALGLTIQPAVAKVSIGVDAASTFQGIETTDSNGNDEKEEPGFGDPRANVQIYGDVAPGVEAHIEALLNPTVRSSKVNSEGDMRVWKGYLTLTDLLPNHDVRMGNIEPDFGAHREDLSINGRTMNNEFVTNQLVAPVTTETGLELSGTLAPIGWSAAVTNGMESDGEGNVVSENSELAYNVRVWGEFAPGFTGSLSFYRSDQSDAEVGNGGTDLFGDMTPQSVVLSDSQTGNNTQRGLADASPQMNAAAGDITAYQLDLGYEALGNAFNAYYGIMEDDSRNLRTRVYNSVAGNFPAYTVTNKLEWEYYSIEFARDLTPQTYFALRYGQTEAEEIDFSFIPGTGTDAGLTNSTPEYQKISVALGHDLNENTRAKLEYLQQEDDTTNNVSGTSEAEFDGVIAQLGVSF